MTKRLETFSKLNSETAREEIRLNAIKRKEIQAQNGSCLSCSYTKVSLGTNLLCSLKNKKVSQYNYCDKWRNENESKGNP